jgi:hypothetical protein
LNVWVTGSIGSGDVLLVNFEKASFYPAGLSPVATLLPRNPVYMSPWELAGTESYVSNIRDELYRAVELVLNVLTDGEMRYAFDHKVDGLDMLYEIKHSGHLFDHDPQMDESSPLLWDNPYGEIPDSSVGSRIEKIMQDMLTEILTSDENIRPRYTHVVDTFKHVIQIIRSG